ncbi:hypothetical protein T492DRAFT_960069 [Pavlovales sp. CCMP2436]|nr:hypothetical protein T492DRAFT_960069 [Pavlovales sp. CCMP2436]
MESFSLAGQTWWSNPEGLAGDKVWSALNNEQQHECFWLRVEFLTFAALSDLGDSTLLVQPGRWMLDHPSYFGVRAISATTLSERLRFVYASHLDERSAEINAIGASRVVRLDFTKTIDDVPHQSHSGAKKSPYIETLKQALRVDHVLQDYFHPRNEPVLQGCPHP